jgi:tRNA dimethylallyltransferase
MPLTHAAPTEERALPEVICIVGPTASGKTSLGVELAEKLGGEVISADSMQIYKHMDVGTAKPTAEETRGIPHHLIDLLEPSEEYSVVQYAEDAKKWITDISSRGKIPVIVGGTGQYVSALVNNISFDETESDPELTAQLTNIAKERGNHFLHSMLAEEDPEAAAQIHENNLKRVVRALEMKRLTGLTLSARNERSRLRPVFARYRVYGISVDRKELYERIDRRVDAMISAGLEDEVRRVFSMDPGRTAYQAIGYKEFRPYFNGSASLEETTELIKKNTRNYAKRQLTWFRREPWVEWDSLEGLRSKFGLQTAAPK